MLQLSHIKKTFGAGTPNAKTALYDLSLTVEKGDFITIIGANGAGKSTLMAAIAGDYIADEGSILLGGQDITYQSQHRRARKIGRLFQDPMRGTAPSMSILQNLALAAGKGGWLSILRKSEKAALREQLSMLDMGLEDRINQPVGLLSGGQRQALTLLMATINPPEVLLLDEHTAALDPGTAEKVLSLTKRLIAEHQLTCLMITHNMQQAIELGGRTLMMDAGKIILDITGDERKSLTVPDLLQLFREKSGSALTNDRMLLAD